MLNRRLMALVPKSRKYILGNVVLQWIALVANIVCMWAVAMVLTGAFMQDVHMEYVGVIVAALLVKAVCIRYAGRMSFLSVKEVKKKLRVMIYQKMIRLGTSYQEHTSTSDVVQCATDGAEQLEAYFGSYAPQLLYAGLASLTVFVVIFMIDPIAALILFVCIPLIPLSIVFVQKVAKRLLARYWTGYTRLGDTFLEDLRGLVTAKLYGADERMRVAMNRESEQFRKVTMRVLSMQLNSIIVMDLIAYGGAALGMLAGLHAFAFGTASVTGCLLIILLSADFFLPLRALGSYFHTAMNGMAAAERIFKLLDAQEGQDGVEEALGPFTITMHDVSFAYDKEREVLHHVDMTFPARSLTAIVGESGCGKSTIAALIAGRYRNYTGTVKLGDTSLKAVKEESLLRHVTYVSHNSTLFKGTVEDVLRMGKEDASVEEMYAVLQQVSIYDFVKENGDLGMVIEEGGANLSGGQKQRLALARALLHNSDVYIFDEASSNIDAESEDVILHVIRQLVKQHTVIMITHRMKNAEDADCIYVVDDGCLVGHGTHAELMHTCPLYQRMKVAQADLESLLVGGAA